MKSISFLKDATRSVVVVGVMLGVAGVVSAQTGGASGGGTGSVGSAGAAGSAGNAGSVGVPGSAGNPGAAGGAGGVVSPGGKRVARQLDKAVLWEGNPPPPPGKRARKRHARLTRQRCHGTGSAKPRGFLNKRVEAARFWLKGDSPGRGSSTEGTGVGGY